MRRFFLAIAVIPLALGLAGCGATSGPNEPTITRPYPNTVEGTTPSTTTTRGGGGGQGDATAGKAVFMSQGCSACHTLKDANASGQVGPNRGEPRDPAADHRADTLGPHPRPATAAVSSRPLHRGVATGEAQSARIEQSRRIDHVPPVRVQQEP